MKKFKTIKTNKGETVNIVKGYEKFPVYYCGKKYERMPWFAPNDGSDCAFWVFFNGQFKEVKLNNAGQNVISERSDFRWATEV